MAKRFENIHTTIKAVVIDIEKMEKNEVEFAYEGYTRSDKKAEEIIREALAIEADALVKITELVQNSDEPKSYNYRKMIHDGFTVYDLEPSYEDDEILIEFSMYAYTANVFYENENGDASGYLFTTRETVEKYSKGTAKGHIAEEFENYNPDCKVVFVARHRDHFMRKESKHYIVASMEDAKAYEAR